MAFVLWYGGQLLADHEYTPFNYCKSSPSTCDLKRSLTKFLVVVYLAVVQGSTSAGQSLSFGPSMYSLFPFTEIDCLPIR